MTGKVQLLTTDREHLFDISRCFADAMGAIAPQDGAKAAIMTVRGSIDAGKRIFFDVLRDRLLGSTALCGFSGRDGHDEFWAREINGRVFEVDYIDVGWINGMAKNDFATPLLQKSNSFHMLRDDFLGLRRNCGVTVMQNMQIADAAIDVWVERPFFMAVPNCGGELYAEKTPLGKAFAHARGAKWGQPDPFNPWVRFLEVSVNDDRLLSSPSFMAALDGMKAASDEICATVLSKKYGDAVFVSPTAYRGARNV